MKTLEQIKTELGRVPFEEPWHYTHWWMSHLIQAKNDLIELVEAKDQIIRGQQETIDKLCPVPTAFLPMYLAARQKLMDVLLAVETMDFEPQEPAVYRADSSDLLTVAELRCVLAMLPEPPDGQG